MSGHIGQLMRLGQLDLAVLFSNDVAPDANNEPLMIEELFLMIPEHSRLVPRGRKSITIVDAADLPLNLPTGAHRPRPPLAPALENRCLTAQSETPRGWQRGVHK